MTGLTRRRLLLGGASAACALPMAVAGRAFAGSDKIDAAGHRILTASDVHVTDYPTVEAVKYFGELIKERTNGRYSVEVYHSAQLGQEADTIEQVRSEAYAEDRAMAIILSVVIFCLLTITALGIVGMASFWVAQRTKQIGTRRALGATKFDILRYFQTENFIITTMGLVGGGILTYAFSIYLMKAYNAPRLPWYYVPVGFVCLWILGQVAVLGPALRASRVSPAIATRSV